MERSLLRRMFNRILHTFARVLPGSTTVRPFLHRLRGVKIDGSVFIGDDVYIENDYPHRVEIADGATIGLRTTIIAHTITPGRVVIQKNACIASGCILTCAPGQTLTIGEGSVISAGSVVSSDVPPHILCAGPRVKMIARVTVPLSWDGDYQAFCRGLRSLRSTKRTESKMPDGSEVEDKVPQSMEEEASPAEEYVG